MLSDSSFTSSKSLIGTPFTRYSDFLSHDSRQGSNLAELILDFFNRTTSTSTVEIDIFIEPILNSENFYITSYSYSQNYRRFQFSFIPKLLQHYKVWRQQISGFSASAALNIRLISAMDETDKVLVISNYEIFNTDIL